MPARVRPLRSLLIVAGVVVFTIASVSCIGSQNPQDTTAPAGPVAQQQKALFYPIFWIAVGIFFVVETLLIVACLRFRHRRGRDDTLPKQVHGNTRLEIGWTIAPTLLLAIVAIPTVATVYHLQPSNEGNPLNVNVIGHQWWWEFQYPELSVVTANELHIPTNRRVNLHLSSVDVIHAFWVPRLAGQLDVVPGHQNEMWFQADHPGTFFGQCTQFCGESHAYMRIRVIASVPNEFDAWVANQQAPPVAPTGDAQAGAQAFANGQCVACHTIQGVSSGKVGPNLTHFASRETLAAGTLDNTPDNVHKWIYNPQAIKPGNDMPNLHLSDEDINNLVTYLETLK
jgi:cytochrome c oxidase subunit 2